MVRMLSVVKCQNGTRPYPFRKKLSTVQLTYVMLWPCSATFAEVYVCDLAKTEHKPFGLINVTTGAVS